MLIAAVTTTREDDRDREHKHEEEERHESLEDRQEDLQHDDVDGDDAATMAWSAASTVLSDDDPRAVMKRALACVPSTLVGVRDKPRPPNPLVENESYNVMSRSHVFACDPPVVHFRGYLVPEQKEAGADEQGTTSAPVVYEQKVRVVNVSNVARRLHILQPSSKHFRIRYNKRGNVMPGLAEVIHVQFLPTENGVHYTDSIKLHCPEVNLFLPLHGYPVMQSERIARPISAEAIDVDGDGDSSSNDSSNASSLTRQRQRPASSLPFPKFVDLGECVVGQRLSHTVQLRNDSAVSFSFDLLWVEGSTEFSITPMQGYVAPHGVSDVCIAFTPTRSVTSSVKVQFALHQIEFEPYVCTLVGRATHADFHQRQLFPPLVHKRDLIPPLVVQPPRPRAPKTVENTQDESHAKPRTYRGIRVPPRIDCPTGVSYILSQKPGKMMLSDIHAAALERQERERKRERAIRAKLAQTATVQRGHRFDYSDEADVDMEFPGDSRQIKELVFQRNLLGYVEHEKSLEINPSKARVGHQVMTDDQRDDLETIRQQQLRRQQASEREVDRQRTRVEYSNASVVYMVGEQPAVVPTFDLDTNDTWSMRSRILEHFISSCSKLVVQQRVASRIELAQRRIERLRTHTATSASEDGGVEKSDAIASGAAAASAASSSSSAFPSLSTAIDPVARFALEPSRIQALIPSAAAFSEEANDAVTVAPAAAASTSTTSANASTTASSAAAAAAAAGTAGDAWSFSIDDVKTDFSREFSLDLIAPCEFRMLEYRPQAIPIVPDPYKLFCGSGGGSARSGRGSYGSIASTALFARNGAPEESALYVPPPPPLVQPAAGLLSARGSARPMSPRSPANATKKVPAKK